jgi:acetyltransferase
MIESKTTRVVIGFMEGFRDIPRMKRLALDAAGKQIPIILIKVGGSEKGIAAARSHTGALAGDAGVMEGFFRQYGIIHVETIEELVETAGIFSRCPLPQGPRLGISTFSGGSQGSMQTCVPGCPSICRISRPKQLLRSRQRSLILPSPRTPWM